jgi:DedD protein
MAFFKSRSPGNASADDKNADSLAAQSLDTLRRQARHRLIGATVLVLLAVIGFPLVFDTKPREVAADIRIDMPDKDAVRSSQAPTPPPSVVPTPAPVPDAEVPTEKKAAEVVPKALVPPSVMPEKVQQAMAKEEEVPPNDPNIEKSADSAPRFIVQVGAFAEEKKSNEVRSKLEKAGIKTYTHIAQTKEGKRIRVRVGPFATKEEAQKTADKIKSLQLSASVLTI